MNGTQAAKRLSGRRCLVLLGLLLAALTLSVSTRSASAAYLHPSLTESFGVDGTSGSESWGVPFGGGFPQTLRFDRSRGRFFLMKQYLWQCCSGINPPQVPRAIYAFDTPTPGIHTPAGGGFPITFPTPDEPQFAIDETEGNVYFTDGTGKNLYGWDSGGQPLPGLPTTLPEKPLDMAVDPLGYLWMVYGSSTARKYDPNGGLVATVALPKSASDISFDKDTDDLWVSAFGEMARLTATSGYTEADRSFSATAEWFTYDSLHHVLYIATREGPVTAYTESGGVIEQFGKLLSGSFGASYRGMTLDEETGTVYLLDDSDTRLFLGDPEKNRERDRFGGRVRVWNAVVTPDVTTGPPSAVGHTTTTVTGHVDPAGGPGITSCEFQYGTTASYEIGSVPCAPSAGPGSPIVAGTDVQASFNSLTPGTTYHYRLIASNTSGQNLGNDETVIAQPSIVKTGPATSVTRDTATLNGTADPEGEASTFYFEYGRTKSYGKKAAAPPGESVGTTTPGDQPVSKGIVSLTPGATYHYRLVEVNGKGSSFGLDRTFTTLAAVKNLSTDVASLIHRNDVTLNATMDPDGLATNYYFEWGKTRRYGNESAAPPGTELPDSTPGAQHPSTLATGLQTGTTYHYRVVAKNATYGTTFGQDRTFMTQLAVIGLDTDAASEVEPTSATFNGHLDPDGIPTTYYFEWGKTKFYGHELPLAPGEDVGTTDPGNTPLSKALGGLEPGTTYHFRLVASNSYGVTRGTDESFRTPQGPSIEGVFSSDVTVSGANLRARINPNGTDPSFETSYRFEYGTTTAYGNSAPIGGTLSPTEGGQNVTVPISGLSEVTYHFRVVAENDWGTTTSEDQTFDFKPPSSCPNTSVRQQTGAAYLPDCRAYELVSPARAGGAALLSRGPSSPFAANRFAFTGAVNAIPGTGEPPNGGSPFPEGDLYVASRGNEAWTSHYVGIPATETIDQGSFPRDGIAGIGTTGIPADRTLSRFLTWKHDYASPTGFATDVPDTYAPYLWDNEGNSLGRLPSNLFEVPGATVRAELGGFVGDARPSPDFSHYAFSSRNIAFAPGGLTSAPGSAYDDDVAAETVTLISKTAAGDDIPQDGAVGSSSEYLRIPAVSRDGSHILMSSAAPGGTTHLYMRVDDALTYEVSEGEDALNHGVAFAGMSEDGSEVFFTTAVQMTADDADTSADLYRWSENGGAPTLTRLSVGSEADEGNSDGCNPEWTSKCGIEVVPTSRKAALPVDSTLASQDGAIYFYSPEELEGARGVPGKRNLYLWQEGSVHHVATLGGGPEEGAQRINVSPDGSHMAFITKTRLTAYDNAGHTEMFTYDPQARRLTCVSCLPDGSPPSSDVLGSQNGIFMTSDGRAFFSTEDALVPRDANGIIDVYEYVGGRAQLISTGAGNDAGEEIRPIGLVGVSANGVDAFISTYETLVPQDENGPFLKFYDARTNGGFPFNKPAAPCAAADECHGEGSSSPPSPLIGSGASLGAGGNVTTTGQVKRQVQKKRKRHKRHKRRHRRHRQARWAGR